MKFVCTCVFLVLATSLAKAQSDSTFFSTDRPFRTASAYTLGKGMLLVETGVGKSDRTFPDLLGGSPTIKNQVFTLNTTQIRFGLSDKVEFNLTQSLFRSRILRGGTVREDLRRTNAGATRLGIRVHLFEENGFLPQIALLGRVNFSIFSSGEGSDESAALQLNFQHNLKGGWYLAYNLGVADWNDQRFYYSALLAKQVVFRLRAFAEYSRERLERDVHRNFVRYGMQYSINTNVQLDIFGEHQLNIDTANSTFGAGVSIRIPKK